MITSLSGPGQIRQLMAKVTAKVRPPAQAPWRSLPERGTDWGGRRGLPSGAAPPAPGGPWGMSAGTGSTSEHLIAGPALKGEFTGARLLFPLSVLTSRHGAVGSRPGGQAGDSCLASWLVIATLRGLAASCTGMARVSTPAV
jgi:hypothetical protein